MCCFRTVDNSAGVKAAVLLAPVGSYACALREVAHRGRLHINDLHTHTHTQNDEMLLLFSERSHISAETGEAEDYAVRRCGEATLYSRPPAAAVPGSRYVVGSLARPPPPRCICMESGGCSLQPILRLICCLDGRMVNSEHDSHVRRVDSVHMSCVEQLVIHRDQNSESVGEGILIQHALHWS